MSKKLFVALLLFVLPIFAGKGKIKAQTPTPAAETRCGSSTQSALVMSWIMLGYDSSPREQ